MERLEISILKKRQEYKNLLKELLQKAAVPFRLYKEVKQRIEFCDYALFEIRASYSFKKTI